MKKADVIKIILGERHMMLPRNTSGKAYAPSNIALCKYWGKREQELNLPVTGSLSISLNDKGATTEINVSSQPRDIAVVNNQAVDWTLPFGRRLLEFMELFRVSPDLHFDIKIKTTIPIGAGLASSACGFASIVLALNALFGWELKEHELSVLARLGSGSACRSIWHGFVEWNAGIREDGMDSYAELISEHWPELCVGLLVMDDREKKVSSRDAMQRTVTTSPLYASWPTKVSRDLSALKQAISVKDFMLLGKTAEFNAMSMHATMLSSWPPVVYSAASTLNAMQKIWNLRHEGLALFFTQDAGPNLKLLFLEKDATIVQSHFSEVDIVRPFKQT